MVDLYVLLVLPGRSHPSEPNDVAGLPARAEQARLRALTGSQVR